MAYLHWPVLCRGKKPNIIGWWNGKEKYDWTETETWPLAEKKKGRGRAPGGGSQYSKVQYILVQYSIEVNFGGKKKRWSEKRGTRPASVLTALQQSWNSSPLCQYRQPLASPEQKRNRKAPYLANLEYTLSLLN